MATQSPLDDLKAALSSVARAVTRDPEVEVGQLQRDQFAVEPQRQRSRNLANLTVGVVGPLLLHAAVAPLGDDANHSALRAVSVT